MNIRNGVGPLAQLVEQFPFKEWVVGSSPTGLTMILFYDIGGYSSKTLFIHSLICFILFEDDG